MKIAISAMGSDPDSGVSQVFGRCPWFIIMDTETMEHTSEQNSAVSLGSGAGIQAAQFVVNSGAEAVITGNLGPRAMDILNAAELKGYLSGESSVLDAVTAYKDGKLDCLTSPSAAAHSGMNSGTATAISSSEELEKLQQTLRDLRQKLADVLDRISELEGRK